MTDPVASRDKRIESRLRNDARKLGHTLVFFADHPITYKDEDIIQLGRILVLLGERLEQKGEALRALPKSEKLRRPRGHFT